MALKDLEAHRAYQREYKRTRYHSDPEYRERHLAQTQKAKDRYQSQAKELIAAFHADGCINCGEKEVACLDAHHLDPYKKDFSIGEFRSVGLKNLKLELDKCVCLCANCHRKFHAGLISLATQLRVGEVLVSHQVHILKNALVDECTRNQ